MCPEVRSLEGLTGLRSWCRQICAPSGGSGETLFPRLFQLLEATCMSSLIFRAHLSDLCFRSRLLLWLWPFCLLSL